MPERGFVLWDEPGAGLGHRKWGSSENIAVTEIFQAFRFMFVNVCFAVPRRGLIDKTARLLLHLEFKMQGRGYAPVYRIIPSDWGFEGIVTPFVGQVTLGAPSKWLTDEYEKLKRKHGYELLERSRAIAEATHKRFEERIARHLKPKRSFEEELELGRKFLPSCINPEKLDDFLRGGSEGRGAIDMAKFKRLTGFAHSRAFEIRRYLLKELKEKAEGGEVSA